MTKQGLPLLDAEKPAASLASLDRSDAESSAASLASLDRSDAESSAASLASLDRSDVTCCVPLVEEPLTATQADTLAPMFKALGDPVRLRLLSMIASHDGEVCVCELTPRFDQTGPTISHHLRVLREAGLVDCERRGTWVYYWLRPGVLDRLATVLNADRLTAAGAAA